MTDLELLIETAKNLSATLDRMAEQERRFGFEICHKLELLSRDSFNVACDIKEIKDYIRG
jgi:hypothetical protein